VILKAAIFSEKYKSIFDLDFYGKVIGIIEMNSLEVQILSPLDYYFSRLAELDPTLYVKTVAPITKQLEIEEDDDYCYPLCQGTALYAVHHLINHSCEPNAHAFKREGDDDASAVILAKRSIKSGEEIVMSYIDEELPYKQRKQDLSFSYSFECECRKCMRESNRTGRRKR